MNESTAVIRNPERWRTWARAITARSVMSRHRSSLALQLLLGIRPTVVRRSSYVFAPSWNWSVDLTVRLQSFAIRPLRPDKMLFTTKKFHDSPVEKGRTSPLGIEQAFKAGPIGGEIAMLAQRFSDRARRSEDRVARTDLVTVARGNADSRHGVERADVPVRSRPEWVEGRASWGRPAESPVPAMNVERITENVMRQIDHRLTAWRERMGRS